MNRSSKKKMTKEEDETFLNDRRRAYQLCFDPKTPHGKMVLEDLANYCYAHRTTMHSNPMAVVAGEAKRDVWLRIWYHLNLTNDEFAELYGRARPE